VEIEPLYIRREWLLFFTDTKLWWCRPLKPGYRHISAAAYYANTERWVFYLPTAQGTIIEVRTPEEADGRLAQLVKDATLILRVPSQASRTCAPWLFGCVGATKALLGIRSRALSPFQLSRYLLRHGAEKVSVPNGELFSA
jgi:hypothetical protein